MVRINPILYTYNPVRKDNSSNSTQGHYQVNTLSPSKPFQCSFLGDYFPNIMSVDLTPVLDIGDVPCPSCGVKTLSQNKFDTLLDEASKIDNPLELLRFFKANKNYIPHSMRKSLFADEKVIRSDNNLSILDYFSMSKQRAFNERYDCFSQIKNRLSDYSNSLENGDFKSSVLGVVESIDSKGSYQDFKNVFFPLVSKAEFDKDLKLNYLDGMFNNLRASCLNFGVYGIPDYKNLQQCELSKIWASKIFSNSLVKTSIIHAYDNNQILANNSVVLCESCSKKSHKNVFMDFRSIEAPRITKFYFNNYLSSIAKLMGESKIQPNRHYFNNFAYYVNKLSKGKVEFSKAEIDRLLTLRALTFRHESFAPIDQAKVDIPCACCGSTMLPHERRMDIQLELLKAKDISDYVDILNANDKYIGVYAKNFKNIFINVYKNNPSLSQEEFMQEFIKRADYFLKNKVFDAVTEFDKNISYTEENGTQAQIDLTYLIRDRLIKYLDDGMFDNYNYSNLLKTIMAGINMDTPECSKTIYMMLNDMKTIAYMSTLITPNDKYDNSDINPIYTLLFNFFKSDVATGDFLLASKKGGKGTKDNLIGLCKGCNSLKTNKSVEAWYTQYLPIRKNFRKQLHVIDKMAKDGMLEGYEDWAQTIAESMYTLTRGRYDIRNEFE